MKYFDGVDVSYDRCSIYYTMIKDGRTFDINFSKELIWNKAVEPQHVVMMIFDTLAKWLTDDIVPERI